MKTIKAFMLWCINGVDKLLSTRPLRKYYRALCFDAYASKSLLVFNGESEKFIVSASDKIIGKRTFVDQLPFEFEQLQKVRSLLGESSKPLTIIDVGANIGTVCIAGVQRGLFQKAIAIEPEPRNFQLLMANIYINGVAESIAAHNIALGERDNEILKFELSKYNFGDHRVHLNENVGFFDETQREIIEVRQNRLDSVIKLSDEDLTLLWIDTQGYEGFVLAGAIEMLSHRIPVCLEFWPYGLNRTSSYEKLKLTLISSQYQTFVDLNEPEKRINLTADNIDALFQSLNHPEAYTSILIQ